MSGVEAIAAILGIAGAGISVSAAIYDVAATAAGAKEDMRTIAESIDTYSSVLETLGRQLEASQAICSPEGIRLAIDLERQSEALFHKISEHLPSSKSTPSLGQKLSWFYNRERVKFLLGQIEQLKATVSLLVQILILAQTSQPASVTKNVNVNVHVVNAEISSQFRRAENRVLQYQNASLKRAKLEIESESREVREALPWENDSEVLDVVAHQRDDDDDDDVEEARVEALTLRTSEMSMDDAHANSAQLVNMLLDHWTIIEPPMSTSESKSTVSGERDDGPGVESTRQNVPGTTTITPAGSILQDTDDRSTSSNFIKDWWQNYREDQRTRKRLETQEKELSRREAQLERERSFVERELKLQEAERQKAAAAAKVISERQQNLVTSQTLEEERDRQKQLEMEARLQKAERRINAKKELAARRAAIRGQFKGAREYSSRPPQQPVANTSSTASVASVGASSVISLTSTGLTTPEGQEAPPPPYAIADAVPSSTELRSPGSSENGSALDAPSTARNCPLTGKAARKQRLQDSRDARKAAKAARVK